MRLFLCLALVAAIINALPQRRQLGAPSQIDSENLSDKDQEIVDFAFTQIAGSTVVGKYDCQLNQIRTENFSKQIVSGTLYKFDIVLKPECGGEERTCNLVVFDQPWTKTREVQWDDVTCDEPDSKVPLLGGLLTVDDLTDEDQEIVNFAFSQVAASSVAGDYDCNLKQIRTENFSKQVVAGTLFRLDLVLRPECGGDEKICSVVVFDQPWTNTREIRWDDVKCRTSEQVNNFGQKLNDFVQIPENFGLESIKFDEDEKPVRDFAAAGAPSQVANLSEDDEEIVKFAFSQISGSALVESFDCDLRHVRTENFTKQVVAGTLFKFDLVLESLCEGVEKVCTLVVFDQPWTETREVRWEDVKCDS